MTSEQKRIFLWTAPRSLSTAFYRSINSAPGTFGLFEPYTTAFGFLSGKEITPQSLSAYQDIKEKLNEPFTGYSTIFVKEMGHCIMFAPDMVEDILPEGYIHTFLIRNPKKSVTSFYKIFTSGEINNWEEFCSRHVGHKGLCELYSLLTDKFGITCVIIDADDLEENPEAVLTKYCDFVVIPFHPSMLDWGMADSRSVEAFNDTMKSHSTSWFKTVADTTTFVKPKARSSLDVSSQPCIVQDIINEHMPYYELMYSKRVII